MFRRAFLRAALLSPWAALAAAAALLQGCDDEEETTTTASCDGEAPTMDIHFHATCLSLADLQAEAEVTLTMESSGQGHTHTLALTAQQVQDIAAGITVTRTSSTDGGSLYSPAHSHQVTFN